MRSKWKRRRPPVWLEAQEPLAQWYASPLGESILPPLEAALARRLKDIFGYRGLQIGNIAPHRDFLASAGLHRRLVVDAPGRATPVEAQLPTDVEADALSLPFASDSMKLVLFFHTLDFCENPHQALREADRVLTEDGQLLIVGFNPWSAFGARHFLTAWRDRAPWNGRFLSRHRVSDWLSVLDYRVLHGGALFIRPPVNSERVLRRLRGLESLQSWFGGLGGLYVLQARKQTVPLTLVRRPHWVPKRAAGMAAGSFARRGEKRHVSASNVVSINGSGGSSHG